MEFVHTLIYSRMSKSTSELSNVVSNWTGLFSESKLKHKNMAKKNSYEEADK